MFRLTLIILVISLTNNIRANSERPNVILIMCDDLGWGDVGLNGNKIIKTQDNIYCCKETRWKYNFLREYKMGLGLRCRRRRRRSGLRGAPPGEALPGRGGAAHLLHGLALRRHAELVGRRRLRRPARLADLRQSVLSCLLSRLPGKEQISP